MAPGRDIRRRAMPLLIEKLDGSGTPQTLRPVALGREIGGLTQHNEDWLQSLIFRFPQVLPVREIEPGFTRLIPVCREMPTDVGPLDNFFVTAQGHLVIAECKLWRNPEARREVVAQIIDYAQSMAKWKYEDLERAIRRGIREDGRKIPLYELVAEDSSRSEEEAPLPEAEFIDTVVRNLRLGRLLLLIVGDGVREGVESLAGYLQRHAGFHFTLAMVELPIFQLPNGEYVVQPCVPSKTVNIERGIVRIADGQPRIEAVESEAAQRTSISQEQQLELLAKIEPRLPPALRTFLEQGAELGVVLDAATKSLLVRWQGPEEDEFALAGISAKNAELITYSVNWVPNNVGLINLAHDYLRDLASIVGGYVRQTKKPDRWYVAKSGTEQPKAMELLEKPDDWLRAIETYTNRLTAALQDRS